MLELLKAVLAATALLGGPEDGPYLAPEPAACVWVWSDAAQDRVPVCEQK